VAAPAPVKKSKSASGKGKEGKAKEKRSKMKKAAAVPVPSVHYPFPVSAEDGATGGGQQQQQHAGELERERQRNVTVSPRPPAQGRSEGLRLHTVRARDGGHTQSGRARGAHHRRLIYPFSSPFLSVDALWQRLGFCLFYPLTLFVYFIHLCDLTRTYLGFACTLLHIHDTPAIIYISLLSRLRLDNESFLPGRIWAGEGVWRCLARASARPKSADALLTSYHQRGLGVAEANAPRRRGFALYQPHDTLRLSSLSFPWSRSAPNR
jgi:hypothetical protein